MVLSRHGSLSKHKSLIPCEKESGSLRTVDSMAHLIARRCIVYFNAYMTPARIMKWLKSLAIT